MGDIRLVIYGTGKGALKTLEYLNPDTTRIVCFLDSNKDKQGHVYCGSPVVPPEKITEIDFELVLIGSASYFDEMKARLLELGVPADKIASLLKKDYLYFRLTQDIRQYNQIIKQALKEPYRSSFFGNYALCSMYLDHPHRNEMLYDYPDYGLQGIDYVRISTAELIARELKERDVKGAIAEVGVYQGHFSKLLVDLFPERPIYLFDTFEGFPQDVTAGI